MSSWPMNDYVMVDFKEVLTQLKVLGKSVGLCKTISEGGVLYISFLINAQKKKLWKFQPGPTRIIRDMNENINKENKRKGSVTVTLFYKNHRYLHSAIFFIDSFSLPGVFIGTCPCLLLFQLMIEHFCILGSNTPPQYL